MTEAVYPVVDYAFDYLEFPELIFSNAAGNVGSRRIKEKTGCELIDVRPGKFVDPALTEQELWKLTIENWDEHRLRSRVTYQELED